MSKKRVEENDITKEYFHKILNEIMLKLKYININGSESVFLEWDEEEAKCICKESDPILAYLNFNLEKKSNQNDLEYILTLLVTIEYYFNELQDSLSCTLLSYKCLDACNILFENETCNPYAASALYWKASSLFSLEGDTRNALKVVFDMYKHLYGQSARTLANVCLS